MGKHTGLYTVCLILFPVAFAGFVVGFGCPVWIADSKFNSGLWQNCSRVFKDCSTLDFDQGGDWMIGVRAVEIFALVMLAVTAAELAYENCCSKFSGRKGVERVAPAIICVLGGLGGLAGVVVFAVKKDDDINANGSDLEYGWAFMLVAAGSGLAFLVGIGFCASGMFLEKPEDSDKTPINPYGNPYLPSSHGADSYEMSGYSNKALVDGPGDRDPRPLPPLALYNGLARHSLSAPLDLPPQEPPYYSNRAPASLPPGDMKSSRYYSYSGDDGMHPQFDLSEGYLPSNSRPRAPASDSYYVRGDFRARGEDPYVRGGRRMEDPYAVRGGDGDGFSDLPRLHGGAGRGGEGRGYDAYDDRRENFYRSARY